MTTCASRSAFNPRVTLARRPAGATGPILVGLRNAERGAPESERYPQCEGTKKEMRMTENRERNWSQSPQREQASKPGQRSHEEHERDRASHSDQSHQDNSRGDRNPGNFRNDRERASEAGRKGGQR